MGAVGDSEAWETRVAHGRKQRTLGCCVLVVVVSVSLEMGLPHVQVWSAKVHLLPVAVLWSMSSMDDSCSVAGAGAPHVRPEKQRLCRVAEICKRLIKSCGTGAEQGAD
jgi:hypothetical protein